jgi:CRP-like cAMP-binding protein
MAMTSFAQLAIPPAERASTALARHPLWGALTPAGQSQLLGSARWMTYRAGRTFLREGDPPERLFLLISGAVKIFHRSRSGAEVTLKLFRAPVFFGEMEVMAERPFLEFAKTLENCEILEISGAVFRAILPDEPKLGLLLARDLADRLCIACCNERALAFADVPTRLANVLLDYAALSGRPCPEGLRLELRLSQRLLSEDLAASRRAVASALEALKRDGILGKVDGRYVIHDEVRLRARSSRRQGLFYRAGPRQMVT